MKCAMLYSVVLFAFVPAAATSRAEPAGEAAVKTAPPRAEAQKTIDPEATRVLKEMSTYLAGLQSLQVQTEAADGVVLTNGAKIQMISSSVVSLRRPNALKSEQTGPGARMTAWYDGKSFTLYCKTTNTYGRVPAPPNIDATLDMARKRYGVEAPASDLAFADPYAVLMDHVRGAQYLGVENVDGVPCHHLAFQEDEVDWQIWVQEGSQPVPRRYVITSKTMATQPEFTVRLKHWNTQATLPAATFEAHLPASAKHVDNLPSNCPATSR